MKPNKFEIGDTLTFDTLYDNPLYVEITSIVNDKYGLVVVKTGYGPIFMDISSVDEVFNKVDNFDIELYKILHGLT